MKMLNQEIQNKFDMLSFWGEEVVNPLIFARRLPPQLLTPEAKTKHKFDYNKKDKKLICHTYRTHMYDDGSDTMPNSYEEWVYLTTNEVILTDSFIVTHKKILKQIHSEYVNDDRVVNLGCFFLLLLAIFVVML